MKPVSCFSPPFRFSRWLTEPKSDVRRDLPTSSFLRRAVIRSVQSALNHRLCVQQARVERSDTLAPGSRILLVLAVLRKCLCEL